MREPGISSLVESHLCLLRSIRFHPPNLHQSRTHRIKPNILSTGRVLRTIIKSLRRSQSFLFSTLGRNNINIKISIPGRAIGQLLPIRAPSMQIAWSHWRNQPWNATLKRKSINTRLTILFCPMADRDRFTIRRDHMIVITAIGETAVDKYGLRRRFWRYPIKLPATVIYQPFPVGRPVRGLNQERELLDGLGLSRTNIQDPQNTHDIFLLCLKTTTTQEQCHQRKNRLHIPVLL